MQTLQSFLNPSIVHLYHEVSAEEIYDILKNHISDIERFISEIIKFLEDYRKSEG